MKTMGIEKQLNLPDDYKSDIARAVEILKSAGCANVYLFGSLASGEYGNRSDIDLAIRGCPKGKFFHLLGKLLLELKYSVDLVNLDRQDTFLRYLEKEGELVQIG
jgi:predicted nucleotidyltransferase